MNNQYEEFDIKELIHTIQKKWWLIAILMIISIVSANLLMTYTITPKYEAKTMLFVGTEKGKIESTQLDQKLILDYKEIAKSRLVLAEVIDRLNLQTSVKAIQSVVSINPINESRLFSINVKHTNKELATNIANEVANTLLDKIDNIIDVEKIQVIDRALVPTNPVKTNKKINMILAGLVGCMLALFIILVLEFFDNSIKDEDDVEKQLDLPVVGIIPNFKGR